MLFKEVIQLVTTTTTTNARGIPIEQKHERQVFADKRSVRQSEFYQAAATGMRPEIMFVVRSIDYEGEELLRYNGQEYNIMRTYETDSEFTELVCQGVVVNHANAP